MISLLTFGRDIKQKANIVDTSGLFVVLILYMLNDIIIIGHCNSNLKGYHHINSFVWKYHVKSKENISHSIPLPYREGCFCVLNAQLS